MKAPEFNEVAATEICYRIAKGESLRKICGPGRDDFLPGQTTVYAWLLTNDEFAKQYARAREQQAEFYVDEIIEIADSPNKTTNETTGVVEERDPQRDRLRVDARKWVASKLAPKKYGDKTTLEHTDPAGNNPFASLMEAVSANGRPGPETGS